jgi:hypothetical protein
MANIAGTRLFIIFASGDIIQIIASESNKKIRVFLTKNTAGKNEGALHEQDHQTPGPQVHA